MTCQCGRPLIEVRKGVAECPMRTHRLGVDATARHDRKQVA